VPPFGIVHDEILQRLVEEAVVHHDEREVRGEVELDVDRGALGEVECGIRERAEQRFDVCLSFP
jgi:hypothetical protein